MVVAVFGHPAVCARLLAARADVRARTRHPLVCEPIHWAVVQGRANGAPESTVPTLVGAGADVNAPTFKMFPVIAGWTPLHSAAFVNNAAEIEELLACGADTRARGRLLLSRLTPLELARKLGKEAAASALEAA